MIRLRLAQPDISMIAGAADYPAAIVHPSFDETITPQISEPGLSDRAKRDEDPKPEIERVFEENLSVYDVRKVWHKMRLRVQQSPAARAYRKNPASRIIVLSWAG